MSSNLKVNTILPSTGTTVTVSGISSVTNSISSGSSITATTFYGSGANLTGISAGTALSGSTNNTVCTVTGANAIQGEANLTFDGNTLALDSNTGTINVSRNSRTLTLEGNYGNEGHPAIKTSSGHDLRIFTSGNNERLRIDSTGNTHLGDWGSQSTIYGKARLNIRGADEIATSFNLANSYLHIGGAESTANGLYPISFGHTKADSTKASSYIGAKVINSASYESTALVFATRNVTTDSAPTERVRIDTDGRLLISNTNAGEADSSADDLVIGNTGSGNSGLTIVTGTGNNAAVFCADSGGTVRGGFRYQHGADVLQFYSGGSVSLQVKSNGIGLHENYPVANSLTIRGAATDDTPLLVLKRHTDGAQSDGEIIGKIQFMSNENNVDSGNHQPRAEIHGVTVSTAGAAKLDFYTVPNSTTTPLKRMTINQVGQVTKPEQPFVTVHINTTSNRNSAGSQQKVPWDVIHGRSTNSNVGSCFSTGNHRFTAPIDGRYLFVMSLNIIADNIIKHRINGADVSKGEYRDGNDNKWDHADASFIYDMNANDYYDCVSQLFGSGQRWNGGASTDQGWDTLSIYLLG